jgi:hypothetical protein
MVQQAGRQPSYFRENRQCRLEGHAMKRTVIVLFLTLLSFSAQRTTAQQPAGKLAFDRIGSVFFQVHEVKTEQTTKVAGQDVEQKQSQTIFLQWTPKGRDAAGNFVVEQKIIGLVYLVEIGGNKISYDSRKPKLRTFTAFDFLVGKATTFTITPEMKVVRIDGREKLAKDFAAEEPDMVGVLNTIINEDALKRLVEPAWGACPPPGALPGKSEWVRECRLAVDGFGFVPTTLRFKLERDSADSTPGKVGIGAELKRIDLDGKKEVSFNIKSAKIKSTFAAGNATFDRAKGRMDKAVYAITSEGPLTIEVGGQESELHLSSRQTTTTWTCDVNPLAELVPAPPACSSPVVLCLPETPLCLPRRVVAPAVGIVRCRWRR